MKASNEISIFIIDDDRLFTSVLKNMIVKNFRQAPLSVSVFETGEQCEPFLSQKPDVLIVDYNISSVYKSAMNGIKIIDMVKEKSPATEIIMVTGEDSAELSKQALQHEAHDFVVKDEAMFQRLEISLNQCLKLLNVRHELKKRRMRSVVAVILVSVLLGAVTTLHHFVPSLLHTLF